MVDDAHAALVRAQGVALATLAVLLNRKEVIEIGEFGRILGLQATISRDTDQTEADILGVWAGYVQEAANAITDGEPGPAH